MLEAETKTGSDLIYQKDAQWLRGFQFHGGMALIHETWHRWCVGLPSDVLKHGNWKSTVNGVL